MDMKKDSGYSAEDQIKRADAQIAESQTTNFLSALHNGIKLLYSDDHRQALGVGYLHKLAEANQKKPERIQQVFDAFFFLYTDTINKISEINKELDLNKTGVQQALAIKKMLLGKIQQTIQESSIYSPEQKQQLQNMIERIEEHMRKHPT